MVSFRRRLISFCVSAVITSNRLCSLVILQQSIRDEEKKNRKQDGEEEKNESANQTTFEFLNSVLVECVGNGILLQISMRFQLWIRRNR